MFPQSRLIVTASALLGFASASAQSNDLQRETWPSPDGKIIIAQPAYRGPILFLDATTHETFFSQESTAKVLGVLWSPDSSWVAFSEYFNPHSGGTAFHVYSVVRRKPKLVQMADGPLMDVKHDLPYWGVDPKRWLPGGRLVLDAEEGRYVEPMKGEWRCDLYHFVIRCHRDGSATVLRRRFVGTRDE